MANRLIKNWTFTVETRHLHSTETRKVSPYNTSRPVTSHIWYSLVSRDKNKGLWYHFSTRRLNSMGMASGVRGTEACWCANAAPAQEQQKSWSHDKTGGRLHRWSNLCVSKHVWKNGWTYISCRCDEASESGMKSSPIEQRKRWRTPKKKIDSAETTLHNQQFSAEGGGVGGCLGTSRRFRHRMEANQDLVLLLFPQVPQFQGPTLVLIWCFVKLTCQVDKL